MSTAYTLPAQSIIEDALQLVGVLAIALQESGLRHRRQVSADGTESGAASGWFQFEKNGGCKGVLTHRITAPIMRNVCNDYNVPADALSLWTAIQYQDIVASCAARLLIHTLPQKLPETTADGWAQYLDGWRPGRPRPESWAGHWLDADDLVKAIA